MSSIMMLRHGKNAMAAATKPLHQQTTLRSMAFKPRRTPPPSIAGVNLKPRPNPVASLAGSKKSDTKVGGEGQTKGWISPHHKDHYDRVDSSTMNHPGLLHGDPHMPIQHLTRGDGKVVLDPMGGRAVELNDYRSTGDKSALLAFDDEEDDGDDILDLTGLADDDLEDFERDYGADAADTVRGLVTGMVTEDESKLTRKFGKQVAQAITIRQQNIKNKMTDYGGVGIGDDELEREFGEDAADAIRAHLVTSRKRMEMADLAGLNTYSPLDEVEEQFRTIDRLTAAEGTTQDLALKRRARSEGRDYMRYGQIPKLGSGDGETDEFMEGGEGYSGAIDHEEVGKGRGYDADSAFGKNSKEFYPYGAQPPSPTYHPDFPKGSNVGNNPYDNEEEKWVHELNKIIYEEQYTNMELGDIDETYSPVNIQKEDMDAYKKEAARKKDHNIFEREEHLKDREEKPDEILEMIKNGQDPNQEAFGPWGECTIKVDRVQKVERGGTTVRYRALVIGGNGNGAAGFGIGKALSPNDAMEKASKHCKRNVFYIDRYLNSGLTYDLAGKHNSCRVRIRAVTPDYGLKGHPLVCEILKYAGISDASSKSHGNRNPYNVVYATFKALQTHESLEEIAMKRGKKLLNLQRSRRLGL